MLCGQGDQKEGAYENKSNSPNYGCNCGVCSYIKYQKTEVEIARFDYRMRVMKEESCRMQNGRGLFADESGDSENYTGYQESIGI